MACSGSFYELNELLLHLCWRYIVTGSCYMHFQRIRSVKWLSTLRAHVKTTCKIEKNILFMSFSRPWFKAFSPLNYIYCHGTYLLYEKNSRTVCPVRKLFQKKTKVWAGNISLSFWLMIISHVFSPVKSTMSKFPIAHPQRREVTLSIDRRLILLSVDTRPDSVTV